MSSLGIGGATPYHQPSNHNTAFNHSFRSPVSYNPRQQTKRKCSYCGVWAEKGTNCYLCGTPVATACRPSSAATTTTTGSSASSSSTRLSLRAREGNLYDQYKDQRQREENGLLSAAVSRHQEHNAVHTPRQRTHAPSATPDALSSATNNAGPREGAAASSVVCSGCGSWVRVGRYCALCRAPPTF